MTDLSALRGLKERVEKADQADRDLLYDLWLELVGDPSLNEDRDQMLRFQRFVMARAFLDASLALLDRVAPDWTAWELRTRAAKRFYRRRHPLPSPSKGFQRCLTKSLIQT